MKKEEIEKIITEAITELLEDDFQRFILFDVKPKIRKIIDKLNLRKRFRRLK